MHRHHDWNLSSPWQKVSCHCWFKENDCSVLIQSFLKNHEQQKQNALRNPSKELWNCCLHASSATFNVKPPVFASSATLNVKPPVSGNVQPPVSHPQHSSTELMLRSLFFSFATCTYAACIASRAAFSSWISCCIKKQANRPKDRSATVLGILHPRNMEQWQTAAPKRDCGHFDANEKKLGREIGSSHGACLQIRNNSKNVKTTLLMCGLQQAFGWLHHPCPAGGARSRASAHPDPDPLLLSFHQEYQSTQTVWAQFNFWVFNQKWSRLQFLNLMLHACSAWSISAQWLGQLAKSRRPQLAFQMCSTKSLTSFISSFSIIKLSSLEQCSQQLDDYWTCCQRSVSLPIFLSHKSQVTVNLK